MMNSKWIGVLMISLVFFQVAEAQKNKGWWHLEDGAVKYKLPKSWASDPFSTSSVCHCAGTINDNGGWEEPEYVGMVVYPLYEASDIVQNHQQVWGHIFVPDSDPEMVQYAGINYQKTTGYLEGLTLGSKAWKLESVQNHKGRWMPYTIYFFTDPSNFDSQKDLMEQILETFERKGNKR